MMLNEDQREFVRETINTCRLEVENKILANEGKMLNEIVRLRGGIESLEKDIEILITRHEFAPVKQISFGLAGGVLLSALGAVLAKVMGW